VSLRQKPDRERASSELGEDEDDMAEVIENVEEEEH
jgi:hypothetical protein